MEKKSLFKISNELETIINTLIDNGGELTEGMEETLSITETDLKNKAIDYGTVIRSMEYEVKGIIDLEIKRLQDIKRVRMNTITRLKDALSGAMVRFDIEEFENPTMKINFRKSESLEVTNDLLIDKKYKKTVVTTTIDKMEIKRALKSGEKVEGVELIKKKNLQIK
jgi:hypothetical protein